MRYRILIGPAETPKRLRSDPETECYEFSFPSRTSRTVIRYTLKGIAFSHDWVNDSTSQVIEAWSKNGWREI